MIMTDNDGTVVPQTADQSRIVKFQLDDNKHYNNVSLNTPKGSGSNFISLGSLSKTNEINLYQLIVRLIFATLE